MKIQLFEPNYVVDECLREIKECLDRGWTGLGYKTVEFEKAWIEYTGYKNAIYLNSASSGLLMALEILKFYESWQDDSEIITTAFTFVSTNHAILKSHLVPHFVDINDTLCLDPHEVENAINHKTKAVIYVGIGGNSGDYQQIYDICRRHNLYLILDASHMAGTRIGSSIVGKEADVVVNSFHAVKNLPTADSGMISFNNVELYNIAKKWSWMGINKDTYERNKGNHYSWEYDVEYQGYKYHGNSLLAAVGITQLRYLESENEHRRRLAKIYEEQFKCYKNKINRPRIPSECTTSCHLFQILIEDREKVIKKLNDSGIGVGVHYKNNLEFSIYKDYRKSLPVTESVSKHVLTLPCHTKMTEADVHYVSTKVINIIEGLE